ncbi:MAG: GH92 family glycosyl hydrolase [Tannerella sp.]|jgi:predicted alpha-1,2-mannosidase|nr:GH92 family glycosyl hydrolase [Tannerella sp.]
MKIVYLIFICFMLGMYSTIAQTKRVTEYVDPSIGLTPGRGNAFAGPALPHGMAKVGPDCGDKSTNSGYREHRELCGFSHTHTSGTGGHPKYGNVLMMAGSGNLNPQKYSSPHEHETIKAGYYSTELVNYGIKAELTATHSCGFHRYTFPEADDSYILIDLGSFLRNSNSPPEEQQTPVGSEVEIINNREISGYSRIRGGWNCGNAYTVYFYAVFDTPATGMGTWKNEKKDNALFQFDDGTPTGAFLQFNTKKGQQIKVKVGISFISIGKAKANLSKEINHWDFDLVARDADAVWEKTLSKIRLEGGTETDKKIFYSSLYRIFSQPINKTGENPKWKSDEPYYDDFYAIWDTYRATHPFLTLVNANKQVEIMRALVDIYRYEGYMPDGRIANDNGRTQGGSNCDVLVADAFAKKLDGIDYETAFASMLKNAEVPPGDDERKQGRGGIPDYNHLGYISVNYERSGSRTVEYAYNDWCIASVARGLGKDNSVVEKYLKRSGNWQNLWRPVEADGFKGFIMPRNADGTWWNGPENAPFTVRSGGSWPHVFYESTSWEYSLYVPHDAGKLIEKSGGAETFIARLDTFFAKNYFQMWNEPGFLTPCLYNYAGAQYKTASLVRSLLTRHFKDTRDGIPGDDDSGSMASWYCFHSMGFFPNAGQDLYLISSPVFKKVSITMDNGKVFTISANNGGAKNVYIKSVRLNGKPLNQSWFRHTDIANGGSLEFEMCDKPVKWDTGQLPPSMNDTASLVSSGKAKDNRVSEVVINTHIE